MNENNCFWNRSMNYFECSNTELTEEEFTDLAHEEHEKLTGDYYFHQDCKIKKCDDYWSLWLFD